MPAGSTDSGSLAVRVNDFVPRTRVYHAQGSDVVLGPLLSLAPRDRKSGRLLDLPALLRIFARGLLLRCSIQSDV